jgi:hypothetical protein
MIARENLIFNASHPNTGTAKVKIAIRSLF